MKPLVVLSLFDGYSGAQAALERAGIPVAKYYASEIDKWAIKIAQKNYPNTIQLGDIQQWYAWDIEQPDLIIGGSPCQGLSRAGRGKGLADVRSKLFYHFVLLVRYVYQPKYFVLENVKLKKKDLDTFNKLVEIEPVIINSALVSAQSRERMYWCNFTVTQPTDKGILLKDVLESGVVDRDKSYCIDANYWKGTSALHYAKHHRRQIVFPDTTVLDEFNTVVAEMRKNKPDKIGFFKEDKRQSRVYSTDGKSVALCGEGGGWGAKTGLYFDNGQIRKLTPIECERLQTLPDNYTQGVSNTQRYRMLGNGFTIDVIAHILKEMQGETLQD